MITQIKVSKDVLDAYSEFRKGAYSYIIIDFDQKITSVSVRKIGEKGSTYDDFLDELGPKDVCFALYHCNFISKSYGYTMCKDVFITWAPESGDRRKKMVAAGACSTIKNTLGGSMIAIQGACEEDVLEETIASICAAKST